MKNYLVVIFVLLVGLSAVAQTSSKDSKSKTKAVGLCELLSNYNEYEGQEVEVSASYRFGFEYSQLFCLKCVKTKIWVEFDDGILSSRLKTGWGVDGGSILQYCNEG